MEGFLRKLGSFLGFHAPDYTTPLRRMQKLEFDIPQTDEPLVVAVDATGMKVSSRGEWMYKIWCGKERKGWIKVHIVLDVKTKKMLKFEISNSHCHDFKICLGAIGPLLNLKDIKGDSAYRADGVIAIARSGDNALPSLKLHKNSIRNPQRRCLRQRL